LKCNRKKYCFWLLVTFGTFQKIKSRNLHFLHELLLAIVEKVNPRTGKKVLTGRIRPAGRTLTSPALDDYFPPGLQKQGET
jgi:hypothetical protein